MEGQLEERFFTLLHCLHQIFSRRAHKRNLRLTAPAPLCYTRGSDQVKIWRMRMQRWNRLMISLAVGFFFCQAGGVQAPVVTTFPGLDNVFTSRNITFSGHIADLLGSTLKSRTRMVLG